MADKPPAATVYRADLLWGFNAIAEEQHSRLAAFLGFEEEGGKQKYFCGVGAEGRETQLVGVICMNLRETNPT